MQYATDVVAVIFVADASAYDVVKCNGVDAATGEEIYREVQLDLTPEIEVFYMVFARSLSIFISERPGATLINGSWSLFDGSACSKFRVPKFCKSCLF